MVNLYGAIIIAWADICRGSGSTLTVGSPYNPHIIHKAFHGPGLKFNNKY